MGPRRLALALFVAVLATAAAASAAPDEPPGPGGGPIPVDRFFKGKVVKVDGLEIELRYDFEDAAQLADFELSIPFRAIQTVARTHHAGQVRITGTGSLRHRAVFDASVAASAKLTPNKNRDFGFAVSEERESEVFTLYCLYDRYFGAGDNVHVPQNMVIKFLARDPKVNKDGLQDWRYCGSRGQKPEIVRGKAYDVQIARAGLESRLAVDDWESKGKEAGRELTSQMVALYGYDADFKVDDLVVRGTLQAEWVEKNRIDLASWTPPPAETSASPAQPPAPESEEVARIRARIAAYPAETRPNALAALIRDASVPEALRAEAVQRVAAVGRRQIVPYLVDGLHAPDEPSRRLSFEAMKPLLGRAFAFRADAPEETRLRAIQGINEHLRKNSADFE